MKTTYLERSLIRRLSLGARLLLLLACFGSAWAQTSRFGTVTMQVTASPRSIPADNQARSRLRASVRDGSGEPAHDGTQVVVHTDLGFLTTSGSDRTTTLSLSTQGGYVSVWLVSDTAGSALVSLNCLDSRTQVYVDFLPPGETGMAETHIVRMGGGWAGYAYDFNEIEARDKAWARFGKLRLEGADALQLDLASMVLRGGPAKLTNGTRTLEAQDFYLELESKRGAARVIGEHGVERITFDLFTLEPRKMDWKIPDNAFSREWNSSLTWLKAREITLFSHEKIVFRHGALYTEKNKVLSLPPIWIMALPGYTGESNNQIVGLNSAGGLAVRLPYFIGASNATTDALQVEKGASASDVAARNRWSLGLVHEYRTGGISGTLEANGIPYDDWGARWRDDRVYNDSSTSSLDLASPDHESLFFDGNYYVNRGGGSLDLRSYYQKPIGFTDTYGASAEWLTDPRSLGRKSPLSYRVGTSVGVQKGVLPGVSDAQLTTGLYTYLDCRSARLGPRTFLTPSVSNIYSWNSPWLQTNTLRSELRLDHSFGRSADLSLSYAAQLSSGDLVSDGWDQLLNLDAAYTHADKWMLSGSASADVTDGSWYSYASWDYYLSPRWRFNLLGTWYQQSGAQFNDQEVYVGTKIYQDREIGVSWSRQTNRVSVELTGLMTTF